MERGCRSPSTSFRLHCRRRVGESRSEPVRLALTPLRLRRLGIAGPGLLRLGGAPQLETRSSTLHRPGGSDVSRASDGRLGPADTTRCIVGSPEGCVEHGPAGRRALPLNARRSSRRNTSEPPSRPGTPRCGRPELRWGSPISSCKSTSDPKRIASRRSSDHRRRSGRSGSSPVGTFPPALFVDQALPPGVRTSRRVESAVCRKDLRDGIQIGPVEGPQFPIEGCNGHIHPVGSPRGGVTAEVTARGRFDQPPDRVPSTLFRSPLNSLCAPNVRS